MPIVYGLTDQGLVVKSRAVIRDDFDKVLRRAFGNSMNLSDGSVLGQLVAIFSDRLGEVWELLETINSSQDPDKATAALLDALCLITGTTRPLATKSTAVITFTGIAGTVIPALSEFEAATTLKNFATIDSATLVTVPLWSLANDYFIGDRVSSGSSVYHCIQTGESSDSTILSGIGTSIVDNSVLWTFVGLGSAVVDADALAIDDGPVVGAQYDINRIINPINGLQGVINLAPAVLGRLTAEDPELRLLREAQLGEPGSSPFDALVGRLLDVVGVTSVTLFVNNTDVTNVDGVPPHSIEALVQGGADQDIFDKLLASVAAGIGTYASPGPGAVTGTALDSKGTPQPESFSRATSVPVYVRLVVTYDAASFPADGNTQIQAAVQTYGAAQNIGRDVVPRAIGAQAFKALPASVIDVPYAMVYPDVIGVPTVWLPSTSYVATVGAKSVVTNGGRAYICVTSGTSAGSGGPSTTATDITDGTAHWYFLGNTITITSRQLVIYSSVSVTSSSVAP